MFVVSGTVMFAEVVGKVHGTGGPVDIELTLFHTVAEMGLVLCRYIPGMHLEG